MPGVSNQRDRAGNDPIDEFESDDKDVECDANNEARTEVGRRRVRMGMAVGGIAGMAVSSPCSSEWLIVFSAPAAGNVSQGCTAPLTF